MPVRESQTGEDIEAWMTWIHTDVSTWTDASGAPVVAWVTDSELVDAFVDWRARGHCPMPLALWGT